MVELENDNLIELLEKADKPVFVDMYAEWCGPCKMISPIVETLSNEYGDKVEFIKVNVDNNPKAAAMYGVRSIPTLFVFKGNHIVEKQTGAVPKSRIVEMLKPHMV